MEEKTKPKKNHWTQEKVDGATKKINFEIYQRKRQAPVHIKIDDLVIYINDRITRRGIAKGLVSIQEDLNKNLLKVQKRTIEALISDNNNEKYSNLIECKRIMKIEIWTDIRFLMVNKAITPGEITELIRKQLRIDEDINRWIESLGKAIPAI